MVYDAAGNQTKLIDPSAGTSTFTYDAYSRLLTSTNNRGQQTTINYLTDGRVNTKTMPEGIETWTYNPNKQLTGISNSTTSVSRTYSYDTKGRVNQISETIPGSTALSTIFAFDGVGRLQTRTHPSAIVETMGYTNGYLSSVSAGGVTRWAATAVNAFGQVTAADYGASLKGIFGYDTYGNPTYRQGKVGSTFKQNYWTSVTSTTGNLAWRNDSIRHKKEYFAYDSGLDRLMTVTGPQNLTMNYAANGNLSQKSDVGSVFTYGTTGKPYQLTGIETSTGLVSDVEQTVSYTSFEQPAGITESPYQALFTYNADGQRAKMEVKQSGATIKTRWYAGSRYLKETAGGVTKEFTWIGGDAYTAPCIAVTQSGTTTYYYLLRDHLGTITHVTDASGNVVNEYSFDAWGRRRNFTDWSYTVAAQTDILPDRGFTAHEYLPWFKLYNMNGRLYDPVVGRFLEPDPVVQDATSTQNLNRYSYCLNNPLKYFDPSGWVMNPGFNSSVWSMIENAWNNTQSNYDMFYSYDNGRLGGSYSLTYSGNGNTFWYSATVGEWYRDSQGNPTEKKGNSASFLTEFYSLTFPVLSNNVLSKSKSENWNLTADISSLSSLILSGIDYAANSSAEYSFKYSSNGSAAAEEAASQTLKSISKGAHVLGHGANIVNALAGIYTFKYSDQSWGDYGKLGVSLTSAGLSVFAYTAPIGLTIGFIDIAGGFNGFYDYLDNQHEFYKTTGGVMLPINSIPNYLRFKR